MFAIFDYTVRYLLRERALMLWAFLFPIILSLLFSAMFSGLSKDYALIPIKLGVIEDANYQAAVGLDQVLSSVSSETADTRYLDLSDCPDAAEADRRTNDGTIDGYITVDDSGTPELHLSHVVSASKTLSTSAAVAQSILNSYVHSVAEYHAVIEKDPAILSKPDAMAAFSSDAISTARLAVTRTSPEPSVRYYFALLAMAAGLAAMLALRAVQRTQANASALGARRTLAGLPRWKMLTATITASWVCSFLCLVAAFLFMRFCIGIDFGGRDGWCLVALAVSSVLASAAGAFAGTFGNVPPGLVSAITCFLSLFTGLYGSQAQQLADLVSTNAPVLAAMNPMWQIARSFYSLLYYDSLEPFAMNCLAIVALAAVFLTIATIRMRRQRYEHL